jgi:hypothetical protein
LFREFWISPGALFAAARGHAPLLALGPSQAPSYVRGELLALPVFSFQKTVLGKEKSRSSGELRLSGHGGHRTGAGSLLAGPPPSVQDQSPSSDWKSTAANRTYPFGVNYVKEPLGFFSFPPALHGVLSFLRFPVSKAYFCQLSFKGAFQKLQNCH